MRNSAVASATMKVKSPGSTRSTRSMCTKDRALTGTSMAWLNRLTASNEHPAKITQPLYAWRDGRHMVLRKQQHEFIGRSVSCVCNVDGCRELNRLRAKPWNRSAKNCCIQRLSSSSRVQRGIADCSHLKRSPDWRVQQICNRTSCATTGDVAR